VSKALNTESKIGASCPQKLRVE